MARLVFTTLPAFESFDDRPALFDGGVELTYRELLAQIKLGKPDKKAPTWPM